MRIAELRRRAGLKQKDVAKSIKVSERYYQGIEYGEHNITCAVVDDILSVVGATDAEVIPLAHPRTKRRRGRPQGTKNP